MKSTLAIIGGGVSATSVLYRLASHPLAASRLRQVSVWTDMLPLGGGVAYGPLTDPKALTITPLREVLPPELTTGFLVETAPDLRSGTLDCYVSRRLVGIHLEKVARASIALLVQRGVAVKVYKGAVTGLDRSQLGITVTTEGGAWSVDVAALCVGSPDVKDLGLAMSQPDDLECSLVNIHAPSAFIAGTNAGAVEALYLSRHRLIKNEARVVAMSPSGRWPLLLGSWTPGPFGPDGAEVDIVDPRARVAVDCISKAISERAPLTAVHYYTKLATEISLMPKEQRADLVGEDLPKIVRLVRRAGGPYAKNLADLHTRGLLQTIKGEVTGVTSVGGGMIDVTGFVRGREAVFRASSFTNCTSTAASPNAASLIRYVLNGSAVSARPQQTAKALGIDDDFRAQPRLFVFGPLLAGLNTRNHAVWHLESTASIFKLSSQFCDSILRDQQA